MIHTTIDTSSSAAPRVSPDLRGTKLKSQRPGLFLDDLNLARRDHVKLAYQRIRAAADSVCSPLAHSHKLSLHRKWQDCRDVEIANAIAETDHPRLTEYHQQVTSGSREEI